MRDCAQQLRHYQRHLAQNDGLLIYTPQEGRGIGLANKVAALTGAKVNNLPNPRNEAVENDLIVDNRCFIELGLNPTTLDDGLLKEVVEIATRYSDRCDRNRILCTSAWTKDQAKPIGNAS